MLLQMAEFIYLFVLPRGGELSFSILYMYHMFLNQLSIHGHLGCFHALDLTNIVAMNTEVHMSFELDFSFYRASLVAQTMKSLSVVQETRVQSLGWEDLLEKEMATHSNILAWKIPWVEEPGRLQSMGSQSWTQQSYFTFTFHFIWIYILKWDCWIIC